MLALLFYHPLLSSTMSYVYLPFPSIFSLSVLLLNLNHIVLFICLPFASYRTLPFEERLEWYMQLMDCTCYIVALFNNLLLLHFQISQPITNWVMLFILSLLQCHQAPFLLSSMQDQAIHQMLSFKFQVIFFLFCKHHVMIFVRSVLQLNINVCLFLSIINSVFVLLI